MTKYKVISFDGGGIRGLITAVWIEALEKKLGSPLREYVDFISGSSTGSILAAAISCGIPASEVVSLYKKEGQKIFPGLAGKSWSRFKRTFSEGFSAPKYDDQGLGEVLKNAFSKKNNNIKFCDLETKTLITSYDVQNRQPIIFKSWRDRYDDCDLWEVVKASCSAPAYFPAHIMNLYGADVPLIDGGVVANNPSACLLSSVLKEDSANEEGIYADTSKIILASFGTGQCTRPINIEDSRKWGALEWALPIIDVLFDGSSDATDYFCSQMIPKEQYFRFQVTLDKAYDDMDNADKTNLNALESLANSYLNGPERGIEKINELAKILKK